MAKKRRTYKKSSKCPEPFNTLIDLTGAVTIGAFVKHKVKKDYTRVKDEEMLIVKHTLAVAEQMKNEGDFVSGITGQSRPLTMWMCEKKIFEDL